MIPGIIIVSAVMIPGSPLNQRGTGFRSPHFGSEPVPGIMQRQVERIPRTSRLTRMITMASALRMVPMIHSTFAGNCS